MKMLCVAVAVFAGACGGDSVSIKGNDPAADARAVTDAVCDWAADCGRWEVNCSGDPLDCTATKVAVTEAECQAEELPDITDDFTCAGDLSAAEANLIEDCVNSLVSSECISQEEMNEYLDAIERGEDPDPPGAQPAECAQLENIFERCE